VIPHSRTILADEDVEAAVAVLRSGQINESETTRELEREASALLGLKHAWATANGTAAIHSVLLCMGIGQGDEVLVPTYVCDDVLSAVHQAGATAVPVDLDPDDLNPSPDDAAAKAGGRARAVILAHSLGMPARVPEFQSLEPAVIEDCAHGLGGELGEAPAGSLGDAAVLSFHGLKMVTAGEGGLAVTDSDRIAGAYARLRDPDFARGEYRLHSRMSNVLSAIAIRQLGRLGETVARRRSLAGRYLDAVSDLPGARPVAISSEDGRRSSCYRFAVVVDESLGFDEVAARFEERDVIVRRPVKQLCHRTLGQDPGSCPAAEGLFDRIVSLPMYPNLTDQEQDLVIAAAREVFS
jgi:dTDP-4-amino-4,6-dideoxygalactose transaminase